MQGVFIRSAVRRPNGRFGGQPAGFTSPDVGVVAAEAALAQVDIQAWPRFFDLSCSSVQPKRGVATPCLNGGMGMALPLGSV